MVIRSTQAAQPMMSSIPVNVLRQNMSLIYPEIRFDIGGIGVQIETTQVCTS